MRRQKENAVITVFFTLTLLVLLSLFLTIIESARITTARAFAHRALGSAMDSVLAEYYAPLMEEYHILGLNTGGNESVSKEMLEEKMKDYASFTLRPGHHISEEENRLNLYGTEITEIEIQDMTGLSDYQGDIFIHEAIEYMKYHTVGEGVQILLNRLSLLEDAQEIRYVYSEKQKAEEKILPIEEKLLELMKVLDGISTDKEGLRVNKDGSVMIEGSYVKKLCNREVTMENVAVNHPDFFHALQANYMNPVHSLRLLDQIFQTWEDASRQKQNMEWEYADLHKSLSMQKEKRDKLKKELKEAEKEKQDTAHLKESIAITENEIERINMRIKELSFSISDASARVQESTSQIKDNFLMIFGEFEDIRPKLAQAVDIIESISKLSLEAEPFIGGYEKILGTYKEEIAQAVYEGLKENLEDIQKYKKGGEGGYDFTSMLDVLGNNGLILDQMIEIGSSSNNALNEGDYRKARNLLRGADHIIQGYEIHILGIDYSGLTLYAKEQSNPLATIQTLIQGGITALVIDQAKISEQALSMAELPSMIYGLDESGLGFSFADFFKGLKLGGKTSGLDSFLNNDYHDSGEFLGEGINRIAEKILFQMYLQEHFEHYDPGTGQGSGKPSVLQYEWEYLLSGKSKDTDNISEAVSKIIFLRFFMNFISCLGDKGKRIEAKSMAAAMVGFTGLPVLVSITQTILLLLLAFGESLVDTAALLMGKQVPLFKKQILYKITDLISLNPEGIQGQARRYPDEEGLLSMSYSDYLILFLFLKGQKDLSYRAMDLIQANLRIRYEDSFRINNCIYGLNVNAKIKTEHRFLFLLPLKNGYGHNYGEYAIKMEYSY